ncbi:hypothetical protein AB0C89_20400 [Streptomyces sp. NPDC048491]|uniref:hypothetical protein n=1 Tax=Streptomyces sp. NPDC048491 TaxID=3157207 RepID=UPI00341C8B66
MQAGHEDVTAACADAEALLRAGRTSAARKAARAALYTDGPDPALYALLGRAHAAEGTGDHADRAEAVFTEGLATFPDDLGLLLAYHELCRTGDDPERSRRLPELVARIRELDPDAVPEPTGPQAASRPGGRMQRHDARLVLTVIGHPVGAAQQAWDRARARPTDDRTAVLAETLTTLARRGRAPLRLLVRAPLTAALGCWAWFDAVLLTVAALHLPAWTGLAALLGPAMFPLLYGLLRGARRRAAGRAPAGPASTPVHEAFPSLPPVPPYTTREKATAALVVLTVAVTLAVFVARIAH